MNTKWSLDELYASFKADDFKGDMEKVGKLIEDFKEWAERSLQSLENKEEKIEYTIRANVKLTEIFTKLITYCFLVTSTDARNETALSTAEKLQVMYNELTEPTVRFEKWLTTIEDLDAVIGSSPLIEEHSYYLKKIVENSKYLLGEELESLIAKMTNSGSRAWAKLQNMLLSTLLVEIEQEGELEKLPLPVIRNMAYDADADIRKKAYDAELKAYNKIEESSAACLNGIKGEAITVAGLRGYTSPLDEALLKSRMDRQALDAMLEAMKESLPDFHKYFGKKGQILGHKKGLPFYDMFAPIGSEDMTFTYEEAKNYIVKSFRTFSDKLADYTQNAFDKRWIDAYPRDGKQGGAFCSNIHPIGESRILANFDGSFYNVSTLAHELGHGYHGYCLKDESILNSSYPMPIAETASIFCETIIKNAAIKDATPEQAFGILERSISDSAQVIVDIYSRFLFESELFERRTDCALSVNELKDAMVRAQKKAYGDGLDHDYLHPYMWVNKTHYYQADRNFYNFPYAFGLLFANGVYAEYLRRGSEFVPEYDKLLNSTGIKDIADVTKMVNIDVHSVEFWRNSLKLVKEDIDKFISIADQV
ncbi:MAG TPA: M3 family oligoendopeptidase [Bacillota bacterium]|nr:M3 family oligoendopeptidase [Bacillota bacterium]